jgi:5-(carboxyamino)imidazole ribonucleotide mutase
MKNKTMVSIAMPKEKDLEVMNESIGTLKSLSDILWGTVVSAHRALDQMITYSKNAKDRGIEVIISTAREAAHLSGMIAALTTLPVIAVPLKSSLLDGFDSILPMLQMLDGLSVATVSVNDARNVGILASQIIGLHNEDVSNQLYKLKANLTAEVEE